MAGSGCRGARVRGAGCRSVRGLLALGVFALGVGCASSGGVRTASSDTTFPVGVAQIDITPDEPIRLTGYGNRTSPSEAVAGRLRATAFAFGGGRRPAVLVSVDLIGVSREMASQLAQRLARTGLARQDLALSVTHTHTGPSVAGVLPHIFSTPLTSEQQAVIDRYSRQLVDKLERVALAAIADRQPAKVAWGQGGVGFASNRRVLKEGKWAAFGVDPAGAVDRALPVLTIRAPDGSLRGVLVNYACHATTLEAKQNFVHGDWPGLAKELIERRHPGAVARVTIGTGADANPNPRGGGLADVDRHATAVANEVDRLLATELRPLNAAPSPGFRELDVRFMRIPSRREWEDQAKRPGSDGFYAQAILARLDRGGQIPDRAAYPVQTWSWGDRLAMVFLGGEVVADYGLRLKREADGSRLWVTAYTNDVPFYVASRRMIEEGGYEVDRSMVYYGQPSPLAEDTEERIIAAALELLPKSFRRPR